MKKKTAILVDAEWFRKILRAELAPPPTPASIPAAAAKPRPFVVTADAFYKNACLALDSNEEELYRLFCYDSEPFANQQKNPIDGSWVRFGPTHPAYQERMRFFQELAGKPFVALRRGVVKGRGWEIKEEFANQLIVSTQTTSASVPITAADIRFGLEQKGVDMRIGMDVASLSIKRLVERIILISGDTDMVPAIKLARREGVQVCVVQVGTRGRLSPLLIEDADLVRTITPMP